MAEFQPIFAKLMAIEGGFAEDDAGCGPVKYGINAKFLKLLKLPHSREAVLNMTLDYAERIYRTVYWDRHRVGQINDQALAQTFYIALINLPTKRACKYVQASANSLGARLKVDGAIGPKTLAALNTLAAGAVREVFKQLLRGWYHYLAETYPGKHAKHLKGWLARVEAS